jgi:hypothetical protein
MNPIVSLLLSLVAITCCGATGVLVAFAVVRALGVSGVVAAILAVLVGVLVATLMWAGGVALLRALRWLR